MSGIRLPGVLLLILGIPALLYGGSRFTKDTFDAAPGPLETAIRGRERLHVPSWVGVAVIIGGVGLVVFSPGRDPLER